MEKTGEGKFKDLLDGNLRKIWKEWELRAMVLFSLGVQIVLLLLGNRRKSNPKVWLRVLVWCAYLTSNSVATVALGILSSKLGEASKLGVASKPGVVIKPGEVHEQSGQLDDNSKLVALWAPLLLLLLGGPDTITAYSLEDNALWLRHLLGLGVQAGATAYVLFTAWTSSPLSLLSLMMILVGLIKYGERTWVLWLASKDKLRESMLTPPDPSPNYPRFMEEYSLKQAEGYHVTADEVIEAQVPSGLDSNGDLSNIFYAHDTQCDATVQRTVKAYGLLQIFKCLFVDLILSYDDRDLSRSIFNDTISPKDAFEMIAIELGFMYDLLYTKAMLLYSVWGFRRRFITFFLTLLMLGLFSVAEKYPHCSAVDLYITYFLLAIITLFEIYSILILVSCDWTDVWLSVHNKSCALRRAVKCVRLPRQARWSDSVAQLSFLRFSINEDPLICHGILKRLNINEKLDKYHYTTFEKVPSGLKEEILRHVKAKSHDLEMPTDASHIGRVLRNNELPDEMWSNEAELDQIILTWHIATELCYHSDKLKPEFPGYGVSKLLSRYMFYLLVMHPVTLPSGIGQIRIRDTFAEAIKFFEERPIREQANSKPENEGNRTGIGQSSGKRTDTAEHRSQKALQLACKMLLKVDTEVPPNKVKGGRSKSVLFDGCRLARVLNQPDMDMTKKWSMISDLWVEILLYAARQSRGDCHAHQLRRGGELLTHVWLLLAHFGLTDHFQMTQGHAIAKLILR